MSLHSSGVLRKERDVDEECPACGHYGVLEVDDPETDESWWDCPHCGQITPLVEDFYPLPPVRRSA